MVHLSSALVLSVVAASAVTQTEAQSFTLRGINYNSRDGPDWAPEDQKCKTSDEITADLQTLKGLSSNLRLYSLIDCNQDTNVIPKAIDMGFKLDVGLWVGVKGAGFYEEKGRLQSLINQGLITPDNVAQIHVGSEAVYRKDVTVDAIIGYYNEIKQMVPDIPLSIADIGDSFMSNPKMIEAVDFVSANYFPFWEKTDINDAANRFWNRYSELLNKAKSMGKTVKLSETGWASKGQSDKASVATPENAAKYLRDFVLLAEEKDIDYYYFEGIDEAWKNHMDDKDATLEGSFGIYQANRQLKPTIAAIDWSDNEGGSCPNTENDVDYPGNDIATIWGVELDKCCDICASDARCNAFAYLRDSGMACDLKSAGDKSKKVQKSGVVSAVLSESAASCPNSNGKACGNRAGVSCCTSDSACVPWESGFYQCISVPEKCPVQETDVDYPGNDLRTIKDIHPWDCCSECSKDSQCKAYTFVNSNIDGRSACYLKSGFDMSRRAEVKGALSSILVN